MPKPSPRPFTLGDLMVLIAAVAAGFPLVQWIRDEPWMIPGFSYGSYAASNWLDYAWMLEPSCFVVPPTLALIPLRWRRPRPPASRVIRQPGAVACLAVAGAMVAGLYEALLGESIRYVSYEPGSWTLIQKNLSYWADAVGSTPMVVIGAWSALALGGRWSPERSWIDRLGRALGVFWMIPFAFGFVRVLLNRWLPYHG